MGTKKKVKKLTATNKELDKTLAVVRGQLTKTETKLGRAEDRAKRWKSEADAARISASRADARVEKLQKKLERASAALEPSKAVGPVEAVAAGRPAAEPTAADGLTIPDQTWTVAQLRAEARARGLGGVSHKPKAQLIAALTRKS